MKYSLANSSSEYFTNTVFAHMKFNRICLEFLSSDILQSWDIPYPTYSKMNVHQTNAGGIYCTKIVVIHIFSTRSVNYHFFFFLLSYELGKEKQHVSLGPQLTSPRNQACKLVSPQLWSSLQCNADTSHLTFSIGEVL